jgi:hypothetical protein
MIRTMVPQRLSFRRLALLFVAASILPLLVVGGWLLLRLVSQQREADEQRLQQLASVQGVGIEREFGASIRALRALAESARLAAGDFPLFYEEARRVAAAEPSWFAIALAARDGTQIFSTARPFDASPRHVVDRGSLEESVRTAKPTVGRLLRGPDGRLAFAVRLPVMREGSPAYVLTAVVTPDTLHRAIDGYTAMPPDWRRVVADTSGIIAVRTGGGQYIGAQLPGAFMAAIREHPPNGPVRMTGLDGIPVYAAFDRVPTYGWLSIVMAPVSAFDAPYRRGIQWLVAFGLLALAVTGAGAGFFAHRMARRLNATREAAERLARGEVPSTGRTIVAEVAALGEALERSAALLGERARERDEQLARAECTRHWMRSTSPPNRRRFCRTSSAMSSASTA